MAHSYDISIAGMTRMVSATLSPLEAELESPKKNQVQPPEIEHLPQNLSGCVAVHRKG